MPELATGRAGMDAGADTRLSIAPIADGVVPSAFPAPSGLSPAPTLSVTPTGSSGASAAPARASDGGAASAAAGWTVAATVWPLASGTMGVGAGVGAEGGGVIGMAGSCSAQAPRSAAPRSVGADCAASPPPAVPRRLASGGDFGPTPAIFATGEVGRVSSAPVGGVAGSSARSRLAAKSVLPAAAMAFAGDAAAGSAAAGEGPAAVAALEASARADCMAPRAASGVPALPRIRMPRFVPRSHRRGCPPGKFCPLLSAGQTQRYPVQTAEFRRTRLFCIWHATC